MEMIKQWSPQRFYYLNSYDFNQYSHDYIFLSNVKIKKSMEKITGNSDREK
jgi:hypothetical protein